MSILLEEMNNVNKIVITSTIERGIEQNVCVSAASLTDIFTEFLGVELFYFIVIDFIPLTVLFDVAPVMTSV